MTNPIATFSNWAAVSGSAKPKAERITGLDFVRACAAFFVVLVHTVGGGFYEFGSHWGFIAGIESMAKVAIPLFFLISGALLVPRDEPMERVLRRIWRLLIPLVVWSVFYTYYKEQSVTGRSLLAFIADPAYYHLWFFYSIIPAYLFLPVLRALYLYRTGAQVAFLLSWFVLGCTLPTLRNISGEKLVGLQVGYFPIYSGYFLAGALLVGRQVIAAKAILAGFGWLLSSAAIALGTLWHSLSTGVPNEAIFEHNSPLVAVSAVAAFVFLRWVGSHLESMPRTAKLIRHLAGTSLGVYILHIVVLDVFTKGRLGFTLAWHTAHPLIGSFVTALVVYALSSLLARLLQRIPFVRRTLPRSAGV